MRPGLVPNVVRVRRAVKESWDSVCGILSKVTEDPPIVSDSVAEAHASLVKNSSENGSHEFKCDASNLEFLKEVSSPLGCLDEGITRLENIIEGDKSCGDNSSQCDLRLGVPKTEIQVGEIRGADISEAESNCNGLKAKEAAKKYLLSDILSNCNWHDKKISPVLGESSLSTLMGLTAGNENERLKKEVSKERGSTDWEAVSGLNEISQGPEVPESDNLLSLKHDNVRKTTVSKHNDDTVGSDGENVTLIREKNNRCNEACIEKPDSILTGVCSPSPINSGAHIVRSPSAKKLVARQSEDCVNKDNLVFGKALENSSNTSENVRQGGIGSLINCIRLLQLDEVTDSSKIPDIAQSKLDCDKGSRKLKKSSLESQSYKESQTSRATLRKTNRMSKKESHFQVEAAELAAHSHSMISEPGKDSRPGHEENIQYSSIISSFQYQKEYSDKLIIRFWHAKRDYSLIMSALTEFGPISLQPLFRGGTFEDICVQGMKREVLPAAALAIDRCIRTHCITSYIESTSAEGISGTVSIPKETTDPDFPCTLLKNPAKAIKIEGLTEDVTLQQLKEAFNFGPNCLTNLFLGSLNSFAYAEFKTLESAEKAIAKHSMTVAGKQLNILRVDVPRTTVARISNFSIDMDRQLRPVFAEHGTVRGIQRRTKDIVDVHFEVTELPNMLQILNSLNGMEVSGTKIIAAPAPVIPSKVVEILWGQPEGRQHLTAVILDLAEKIGEVTIIDELKQKLPGQLLSLH